jgi:hypothetical protein
MLKKNGVSSMPTITRNLQQCEACILGKQRKQPFHDSTSRKHRKVEFIHSNLCGPMPLPSIFGNKYIMNFIYDYTRMRWVSLMKHKSQEFETIKNFHLWIENETQSSISILCTDNRRKYICN